MLVPYIVDGLYSTAVTLQYISITWDISALLPAFLMGRTYIKMNTCF